MNRRSSARLSSVDALRGLIMIVMALDHTRDYFHHDAGLFSPTDLAKTNAALFFTRWITHFCAPVFMFTAGIGAHFWWRRGRTTGELSRYLLTRGLWLIFLEATVLRFALYFNVALKYGVLMLVLWGLGCCMMVLAGLVWLPWRVLAGVSVAAIALHNLLDPLGLSGPVWTVLHQVGAVPVPGGVVIFAYPIIPWFAVMSGGFCFARVLELEAGVRRRILLRTGLGFIVAFVAIRGLNVYGDLQPWAVQKDAVFTVMSFLNCTKNPPSLDFLLMTLGPALLVLGRVPLFFFIVHFYTIHLAAEVLALLRYGSAFWPLVFVPPPSVGGAVELFPKDFGVPLGGVYVAWGAIVLGLYPVCRWYGRVKAGQAPQNGTLKTGHPAPSANLVSSGSRTHPPPQSRRSDSSL